MPSIYSRVLIHWSKQRCAIYAGVARAGLLISEESQLNGLNWSRQQEEALAAGWHNPRLSVEDVAEVLGVLIGAARGRAQKLNLGRKATEPRMRVLSVEQGVARVAIPGMGGRVTFMDEDVLDWFFKWPGGWFAARSKTDDLEYVCAKAGRGERVHRLIIQAKSGQEVDHRNHNGLDNRRSNLRIATRQQNGFNARKRKNSSTSFKGIWFEQMTGRYCADIKSDLGRHRIGRFSKEIDAARARDFFAAVIQGEFAHLNLPDTMFTLEEIRSLPGVNVRCLRTFFPQLAR